MDPHINKAIKILKSVIRIYVFVCLGMYLIQNYVIYHPQDRSITTPKSVMTLNSGDTTIIITKSIRQGNKAIIYFGGNAEDVSLNLYEFEQQFPDHSLYLMHYRGYGGSSGKPSEEKIYQDAKLLYEVVSKDHSEISIIGRSLGTGIAVHLASERPVHKLVLVTPYDSMETIARNNYPFLPIRLLLHDKFNSWLYAEKVNTQTTILMAENDEVIPASSTKNLYFHFKPGIANIIVIKNVGHDSISGSDNYYPELKGAIGKQTKTPKKMQIIRSKEFSE